MKKITVTVLALALAACSSSSSSTGSSGSSTTPPGTPPGTPGTPPPASGSTGCTVTFGGDAASVTAKNCTPMGPFTSDATVFEFHGDADGLDAPIYAFSLKYPNGVTAKTYQTADMYYVSNNLGVKSTGKDYYVDFDSRDATKERNGSVVTTFTSAEHGTVDITLDSTDTPPAHATVHITF